SHDTERLAAELPPDLVSSGDAKRFYLLRYALAACFASGVLMPMGYEYGFRHRLDVVRTRPTNWEVPWFDLSPDVAEVNRIKAAAAAFNEEGPQPYVASGGGIALLRSTNDTLSHAVFAANPSLTTSARVDLAPLLAVANLSPNALANVTSGARCLDSRSMLDLS